MQSHRFGHTYDPNRSISNHLSFGSSAVSSSPPSALVHAAPSTVIHHLAAVTDQTLQDLPPYSYLPSMLHVTLLQRCHGCLNGAGLRLTSCPRRASNLALGDHTDVFQHGRILPVSSGCSLALADKAVLVPHLAWSTHLLHQLTSISVELIHPLSALFLRVILLSLSL